mmetsp:Transcript_56442/g.126008  ORF Transcript_56442/g.126008 Transcript_56442/m.126008 type:complete len:255 (+) Transcript_56442:86-850(+)
MDAGAVSFPAPSYRIPRSLATHTHATSVQRVSHSMRTLSWATARKVHFGVNLIGLRLTRRDDIRRQRPAQQDWSPGSSTDTKPSNSSAPPCHSTFTRAGLEAPSFHHLSTAPRRSLLLHPPDVLCVRRGRTFGVCVVSQRCRLAALLHHHHEGALHVPLGRRHTLETRHVVRAPKRQLAAATVLWRLAYPSGCAACCRFWRWRRSDRCQRRLPFPIRAPPMRLPHERRECCGGPLGCREAPDHLRLVRAILGDS